MTIMQDREDDQRITNRGVAAKRMRDGQAWTCPQKVALLKACTEATAELSAAVDALRTAHPYDFAVALRRSEEAHNRCENEHIAFTLHRVEHGC